MEQQFDTLGQLENYNNSLTNTEVQLYGDKTIIGEVVQLLAYIRHGLNNNVSSTINVKLNTTVANPVFMMTVNGMQVPDLVLKTEASIN